MNDNASPVQEAGPTRSALANAARRRLMDDVDNAGLSDGLFAAAALGRCSGVSAVVRGATPFEVMTFAGIEADAVRVVLRQVLRSVSEHEHALPAGRWFSGSRWRQLLSGALSERATVIPVAPSAPATSAQPAQQIALPGTLQPRNYHSWTGEGLRCCARCGVVRFQFMAVGRWRYRLGERVWQVRPNCRPSPGPLLQEVNP